MASFRRRTPRALQLYAVAATLLTLLVALLGTNRMRQRARNAQRVRPIDDTFAVDVPGAFLGAGTYTLHVLMSERLVAWYALRGTR